MWEGSRSLSAFGVVIKLRAGEKQQSTRGNELRDSAATTARVDR